MTAPTLSRPDKALVALFEERGFARLETPILQPANLFLELSGENIRRRLFLTSDLDGREFCLRPEHTIPVGRHHIESGAGAADYCYCGPVFRQRGDEPGEFLQAGVESLGREDAPAADAEVLAVALEGLALYGQDGFEVALGDMGLLGAILGALAIPPAARRRIVRQLAAGRDLDETAGTEPRPASSDYSGLLAAIEGQDPGAARAFVEDVISIAGITRVGGRSAGEIAERFLSRAANRSGGIPPETHEILRRYLAIAGELRRSAAAVADLAAQAGLALGGALDGFRRRTDLMEAARIAPPLRFAANLVRNLDYYTGFVFEVRDRSRPDGRVVCAGGRYDGLLQQLGGSAVPAVGCSFWLDRLGGPSR